MVKFFMAVLMMLNFSVATLNPTVALPENGAAVFLDGRRVATALEQDGDLYLPMREFFCLADAEAAFADNQIEAVLPLRGTLIMQMGQTEGRLDKGEYAATIYAEQPPFIRDDIIYLPLKKKKEKKVMGYNLERRGNAVWLNAPKLYHNLSSDERFTLNLLTGVLYLNGRELCRLDLPSAGEPGSWYPPDKFGIHRTPAGNYLFQAGAMGSGALSFSYQLAAWIPAAGGEVQTCGVHSIIEPMPQPFWQGKNLWLADDDGSICVNERTSEITRFTGEGQWICWWANERYMLLSGLRLYDRKKETLLDLTPLLLTPEVQAEAEEFLQSEWDFPISDSEFEWYWSYLNIGLPMADPVPELHFNYAKGKKLYFSLICNYRQEDSDGLSNVYKEYPLVYKLPK